MTDNDHYYRQHRLLSALFSCSVVVYWVTIASMQRLINTGKVWGSFLLICYCSILSNGHYTASMGYFEVNSHTIAGRVFSCVFFLAFDFCRLGVIIRFYHPRHNAQWSLTSKDFYPRSYPLHFFVLSLFFRKSQYFPFKCLSAKQGNYWYHFYNVFGMTRDGTRDLPHSKPALYP